LDLLVPERLTAGSWNDVTTMLIWLWCFVGSMIMFAGNLLLAHGIIPSLTSSRDLPMRYNSFRPVLFAVSGLFLILAIVCFVSFVVNLQNIYDIYPQVWI
jgi:hypothetical protein